MPGHPGRAQRLIRTRSPAVRGAIPATPGPLPYDSGMPTDRRGPILVVDDDMKIRALVRTYLERAGFAVVEAADGEAALGIVTDSAPALIVLDVMLPVVDGLSVLEQLRADGDMPVIMLSARGTTADRIAGLTIGADDYLPKPFSPAELVARPGSIPRPRRQRR